MVTVQLFAYPVSDETLPDKTDACTSSTMQMQTRLWSLLISAGNSEPSGTIHAHERCEALDQFQPSSDVDTHTTHQPSRLGVWTSDTLVGPAPPPWTTCGSLLSLRQPTEKLEDD